MCNRIKPCACSIRVGKGCTGLSVSNSMKEISLFFHEDRNKVTENVRSLTCCPFLRFCCFREAPGGRFGSVKFFITAGAWLPKRAEIKWKHSSSGDFGGFDVRCKESRPKRLPKAPPEATTQWGFITKRSEVSFIPTCFLSAAYVV